MTIWDNGGLVIEHHKKNEKIPSKLSRKKIQGRCVLIKTKFGGGKESVGRNWLFFKRK